MEIVGQHALVRDRNIPVQGQKQCNRVFGHRMRGIIADARDGNAQTLGFGGIDIVETRTAQRQQMHAVFGQNAQGGGVGMVVDENAGTAAAGGLAGVGGGKRRLDKQQVMAGVRIGGSQAIAVVIVGAVDGDFHSAEPPLGRVSCS